MVADPGHSCSDDIYSFDLGPLRYKKLGPVLMRSDLSSYLLRGYPSAIILPSVGEQMKLSVQCGI